MSAFWHQPAAERTLRQAATLGRLSRSFLFAGPDGVGKWSAALWVAQALLCREKQDGLPCGACRDCARVSSCTHPDLHLLFPIPGKANDDSEKPATGGGDGFVAEFMAAKKADPFAVVRFKKKPLIKLDRIRELLTELSKTSIEGGAKVVIIHSADQTKDDDSQSVMLKSIEEPPTGAHFILTSSAPERLLPTIHSRCQTVRFVPVDPSVLSERLTAGLGLDAEQANTIARLSGGGWGNATRLASDDNRAWRDLMTEFWSGAFRGRPFEMLNQLAPTFRPGNKPVGFDALMQAFDVWSYCVWRDCLALSGISNTTSSGAPIRDLETGLACWRILQNARSTLYFNVGERHVIAGTFLALRKRVRAQSERSLDLPSHG